MDKIRFKDTDDYISMLGFGCMRLPVDSAGEIDRAAGFDMVDHAIANGVNYFDTAYVYHGGKSELFMGEALERHPRDSFFLASKMPVWLVNDEGDVTRYFEEQLTKCRVDHFDYYLVHALNSERFETAKRCRIYEILLEERRRGRLRHLGFSFHDTPGVLEDIAAAYDWEFAQIQLNYLDWEVQDAKRQHRILLDASIPIIVMEPVRGGTLASLRERSAEIFKEANPDETPASWAMRFAGSLPGIMTILSGMSSMPQLLDNIRTMSGFKPLDDGERATIARALEAYRLAANIPCTNCRYCVSCPMDVDIPQNIAIYNNYLSKRDDNEALANMLFELEYTLVGGKHGAGLCADCRECLQKCPQRIAIPDWMEAIAGLDKKLKAAG
ncbi:MAG: aldo/keto reductase [Synergistaceae bacterium]|jgi:predicted aldo/keto reductase-like oxidoreductase|nr:aldo/keto reductase [Synergistaceae bacterium]